MVVLLAAGPGLHTARAIEQDSGPAPDFFLKDLMGNNVTLTLLRGHVVVISFWATWCPACKTEMPALNKLYNELQDRGLKVVAIATDHSEEKVQAFLALRPVDFTVLLDTDAQTTRKYKVFAIPSSFLIDKSGVMVKRYFGETDWNSPGVREEVMDLLR